MKLKEYQLQLRIKPDMIVFILWLTEFERYNVMIQKLCPRPHLFVIREESSKICELYGLKYTDDSIQVKIQDSNKVEAQKLIDLSFFV